MTITKEEFDSLQQGDELISVNETIIVEFKMPNSVVIYNPSAQISSVCTLEELQDFGYQLKPKTKHLHGFPVGDYSDKNVFVSVSCESLEDAKNVLVIRKLLEVKEIQGIGLQFICLNDDSLEKYTSNWEYAILLSKKLTLEYALENKFTHFDCVRFFNKDLTDEECDFILWEHTCHPFNTEIQIEDLNRYFNEK